MQWKKIKYHSTVLIGAYLALILVGCIAFYRENSLTVIITVTKMFYLFFLPGYALLLPFEKNLDIIPRVICAPVISLSWTGVILYLAGSFGIKIYIFPLFIPALLILFGMFLVWLK